MKSQTSTKVIIGLVVLVVFMSVGYAIFAQVLNITAGGTLDYNWNVHFDSTFTEKGITVTPQPTITNYSVNFNVAFSKPGESKTYVFKVLNEGTIDASLKSVVLTKGTKNAAGITFSYSVGTATEGIDVVALTQETTPTVNKTITNKTGVQFVTVVMTYDSNTPPAAGESKDATFSLDFNYEQL